MYQDLLIEERKRSKAAFLQDAIEGAKKFFSGLGKHGKFYDLRSKEVKEWEKEFQSNRQKPKSKLWWKLGWQYNFLFVDLFFLVYCTACFSHVFTIISSLTVSGSACTQSLKQQLNYFRTISICMKCENV